MVQNITYVKFTNLRANKSKFQKLYDYFFTNYINLILIYL